VQGRKGSLLKKKVLAEEKGSSEEKGFSKENVEDGEEEDKSEVVVV
jgi:hypothetical protein